MVDLRGEAAMSDNSWFWFVLFLSAVLAIMGRVAIRGTSREKFMKSLGHSLWVTALFQMKALKQTINVTSPVFLGFSIPFPREITSVSQIGVLFVAVVYIIFWLWMQRSPATYIEHAFNYVSPEEFTRRRMILTLAFGFFWPSFLVQGVVRLHRSEFIFCLDRDRIFGRSLVSVDRYRSSMCDSVGNEPSTIARAQRD
jgi:hypothetical protein